MDGTAMERKRLVADRFKRIWSIVAAIDQHPGLTRGELAQQFALSERQLQADLNVIREDIGLPLTRERGYRFTSQVEGELSFTLTDVYPLYLMVRRAKEDPSISPESLASIACKLHRAFPAMLQPLVKRALAPGEETSFGPPPGLFAQLAEALARHQPIKLHYPPHTSMGYFTEPIVDPQLVLPYREVWFLVGRCHQRRRVMMFPLDDLQEVTFDVGPAGSYSPSAPLIERLIGNAAAAASRAKVDALHPGES
jgi:predicted DNA-binding transcriptional regulator YafY